MERREAIVWSIEAQGTQARQIGRQVGRLAGKQAEYKPQQHSRRLTVICLVPPIQKRKGRRSRAGRSAPSVPRALEIQFRHCRLARLPDRPSFVRSFVRPPRSFSLSLTTVRYRTFDLHRARSAGRFSSRRYHRVAETLRGKF